VFDPDGILGRPDLPFTASDAGTEDAT
jgi:hypothetical protein